MMALIQVMIGSIIGVWLALMVIGVFAELTGSGYTPSTDEERKLWMEVQMRRLEESRKSKDTK